MNKLVLNVRFQFFKIYIEKYAQMPLRLYWF